VTCPLTRQTRKNYKEIPIEEMNGGKKIGTSVIPFQKIGSESQDKWCCKMERRRTVSYRWK